MDSYNICVCFSDTGGGHRSAAEAVETGLYEVDPELRGDKPVKVFLENIAEKSHPVNQMFVDLYNYILRHRQEWMKYYYWFIEATKPNNSALGYLLVKEYLMERFRKIEPAVVVSVHPMVNHYLTRAMKDLGIAHKVKFIIVITDPNANLWTGWACKEADLTIAPNDLSRDQLVKWGIAPEKIRVVGMPIQPCFSRPPVVARPELLRSLGLDPDLLTVCVTAGWAGGGNMVDVYRALCTVKRPVQSVFICGHNKELFDEINAVAAASTVPTAVLPFCDSMSDLMGAVDLLVTKAGGLTTFEAIARRLPMAIDLLTEAMPQESGTANMLIEQGLAKPLREPTDIIAIVESLQRDEHKADRALPEAHSLDRVSAVYDIARLILDAGDQSFVPQPETAGQQESFNYRGEPAGFRIMSGMDALADPE